MPNYYDRVLEDFGDAVLDDAFDDAFDDAYDEDVLGEARGKRRPGGAKLPGSVGRASNFGKNIPAAQGSGNFVTKAELKNSLNSISQSVNDLKKSSISLAGNIKKLDDGYEKIIRGVAKKDKAQDSVMNNSVLMTMMGTLINKPVLNPEALTIVDDGGVVQKLFIQDTPAAEGSVSIDPVKTMLFAMLPTMMNGSSSSSDNSNMMMMMLMVMLMSGGGSGSLIGGSGGDTTLVMVMMMMMMMGKK